ncbi:MAG: hypothetical protein WKG00_06930 [Polyangiaceae bacterium]
MTSRKHFRAHGRRRVDLAATLFVRPLATPGSGESTATDAHGVRIVDLGLGGACVELGHPLAGAAAPRLPMTTLPVPGTPLAGRGGVATAAMVESRRPDLHAWRGDAAAWTSEPRSRAPAPARSATARGPAAATARPRAAPAPPPGPDVEVPADSGVTLEVTAPTLWDPLVLRGRVAWVRRATGNRPMRAGIRFEHRDASALFALFQLLGAHAYDV